MDDGVYAYTIAERELYARNEHEDNTNEMEMKTQTHTLASEWRRAPAIQLHSIRSSPTQVVAHILRRWK